MVIIIIGVYLKKTIQDRWDDYGKILLHIQNIIRLVLVLIVYHAMRLLMHMKTIYCMKFESSLKNTQVFCSKISAKICKRRQAESQGLLFLSWPTPSCTGLDWMKKTAWYYVIFAKGKEGTVEIVNSIFKIHLSTYFFVVTRFSTSSS